MRSEGFVPKNGHETLEAVESVANPRMKHGSAEDVVVVGQLFAAGEGEDQLHR